MRGQFSLQIDTILHVYSFKKNNVLYTIHVLHIPRACFLIINFNLSIKKYIINNNKLFMH